MFNFLTGPDVLSREPGDGEEDEDDENEVDGEDGEEDEDDDEEGDIELGTSDSDDEDAESDENDEDDDEIGSKEEPAKARSTFAHIIRKYERMSHLMPQGGPRPALPPHALPPIVC